MAVPLLLIASIAAQAMDREKKQGEARKLGRGALQAQYAKDMGAPGYGYQAARYNDQINDIEGTNYLQQLMPLLNKQQDDDESGDE